MTRIHQTTAIAMFLVLGGLSAVNAGPVGENKSPVTEEEANRLQQPEGDLTPLGGVRSANEEGTIPAWTGGLTEPVEGKKIGDIPVDLYESEEPLFKITSSNMSEYSERLNAGTKALLKKYPDSFYINVYKSHRTAAAPDYVYDNTYKNATRCHLTAEGYSVEGCFGGIPFPIAQNGYEHIFNHLLRVEPEAKEHGFKNIVGNSDGTHTLASRTDNHWQHPYYYKDGSPEDWGGLYAINRLETTGPPFKTGETLVVHNSVNPEEPRQTWQYLVGQRRVRRAPTVGYDTPDFVASGANYFDEVLGFFGHHDRYHWEIVGKRELYVPYNTNAFHAPSAEEVLAPNHLNPEKLRWELHRVWEVKATVAEGKRHAVPKRHFFFDEDSRVVLLVDGYDSEGKLWRATQTLPFVVPKIPAVVITPVVIYDLEASTFSTVQLLNGETYRVVPRKPEDFYSGQAVAADAMR